MSHAQEREVSAILERNGAVLTGHFVGTSWKHLDTYINKDALYPHTTETSLLCRMIANHFAKDGVEAVIAPAVGGVILSQWTAYHLTGILAREVLGLYAEKHLASFLHPDSVGVPGATKLAYEETGRFVIKRGYDKLVRDKRVLITEDLLTTGGSVRKVVSAVRESGGEVVGVGVLCNRGGITPADLGDVPKLIALLNVTMNSWTAEECARSGPCSKSVPVNTNVGHGREFLDQKQE